MYCHRRIIRDYDAIINRFDYGKTQTLGEFTAFKDRTSHLFSCKTIELEVESNQVRDDAIPKGYYKVVKRYSKKYKWHFHITGVPGRSLILIHSANFSRQLLGCVAVGEYHSDIDKDGLIDVANSRNTMAILNAVMPKQFILKIQ